MDWKELFEKRILERGYDYYRSNKVEITTISSDEIGAVVSGTDDYEVNIYYSGNEIDDMFCDCPYAVDGKNCKHMAAVLYMAEGLKEMSGSTVTDMEGLLNSTDAELIKKFLINAMKFDTALKDRFVRFISAENGNINIDDYKTRLSILVKNYSDKSGFINWKNASPFIGDAVALLEECTENLIKWKRFVDAFEISSYYNDEIMITAIDDDGDISYFQSECFKILEAIAVASDLNTKRRLFNMAFQKLDTRFSYFSEIYFLFIRNCFDEDEFLEKMLDYSDKVILKKNIDDYELEEWIVYHIELMGKLDYSFEDIEFFCKRYWKYNDVREYLADKYLANGDTEKAVAVLKESLEIKKGSINAFEALHSKLKDIYKQIGDKRNYVKELWIILTKCSNTDLNYYLEYKSLFADDEWKENREKLFSSMKYKAMLPEYFIEEGLIDRLADYVFENNNIYLIEKYESLLVDDYSELVLGAYANELNKAAERTADRPTYKCWADKLRHMKNINNGEKAVNEIIERWRELYCNRRAMMQEINMVADEL
ncbi:SWIM zinc finger [Ruminococcus flavefaciens]|uniref:SWIM zinc finger n=1 Tax=Ruminococcus flavefaciens TaxID=1265 RepID=A0A1H6K9E9_RUMFL|nr:SWIM zinc finger family protein [Ruminococcus flavefaciens]SEH71669.1 SWIM zinc finger [Ruminococcus flavefaciens]